MPSPHVVDHTVHELHAAQLALILQQAAPVSIVIEPEALPAQAVPPQAALHVRVRVTEPVCVAQVADHVPHTLQTPLTALLQQVLIVVLVAPEQEVVHAYDGTTHDLVNV